MSTRPTLPNPDPDANDPVADRIVGDVLACAAESTHRMLTTAAGGDRHLLRAIVLTGLGLGELVRHDGRWRWGAPTSRSRRLANLISDRSVVLADVQLMALRALTEPLAKPYAVIAAELENRAVPDEPTRTVGLTQRERQILVLLGDGLTAQAIARRLSLSPRTVAKHQERMYRKFGTSDRLTTVLQAQRLGLLRPVAVAGQ
jgi:DNA-binding CsgD family transcriptional regulator